ncbi:cobalt-precorrin-5B (C(1))-methyltransferase CbiD [Roseburia sp. 1XD42-69]|uniref:cobalt-precorrin-5B (C(1))-methyltransferase CbiD n=1 Tax=Roseburia sp. 1XD42-69 TaxID=2320088 RepID=UPI000EA3506D|nr:cobalt-precorrin-5B (C(1))-methyltransferase CbiD [Roseburia sp. 1XD42-69]RKJ64681.1 cobalamin biosynthesis protein CbiD [Roseburia sp. 1XD42-69]
MKELKDQYVLSGGKKLYCGCTTGSCSAAAAKAAALMLFLGEEISQVRLITPAEVSLTLGVEDVSRGEDFVRCAVKKNAGDDPDVTDGILIYAKLTKDSALSFGEVLIDGGVGVGRVTRAGLNQPIGGAAINSVPREMIKKEVQAVLEQSGFCGGAKVLIEVPEGEKLAEKTFNPRLGIEGGISILGTTGIVVPMSEEGFLGSVEAQINMQLAEGKSHILITPGNYGEDFARACPDIPLKESIHCSNFVGKTLDLAVSLGVKKITFAAHIGKFIKVAGNIMDTHSKNSDCRAELMAACAIEAGADLDVAKAILKTAVTEEAVQILKEAGLLQPAMALAVKRIHKNLCRRAQGVEIDVILFSSVEGKLAEVRN